MTIRQRLSAQKRISFALTAAGFGLFLLGTSGDPEHVVRFSVASLALVASGFLYLMRVRCPHCHKRLGYLIGSAGGPLSVSKKLRCCTHCSVDLDAALA